MFMIVVYVFFFFFSFYNENERDKCREYAFALSNDLSDFKPNSTTVSR